MVNHFRFIAQSFRSKVKGDWKDRLVMAKSIGAISPILLREFTGTCLRCA
jgi:hypothetical protein